MELRRYISKTADIFGVAIDMFNEEKVKGDVTADISSFRVYRLSSKLHNKIFINFPHLIPTIPFRKQSLLSTSITH
ncbi:hypothetical protein CN520_16545 [Bacillus cereus]|nr:hypothetical protein COM76_20500 [Bacillus cereus]PGA44349.1 hypothetical protein COL88_27635 [Bacillus thuringiensis]PDZ38431.1 hypothetical protein CON18_20695 [Bacillus cereus]PEC78076.1 hypothetical protein CON08_19495 [Bacillus cereus]PET24358.1 hypothetical protein CN513_02535 [Bacillus cereus]